MTYVYREKGKYDFIYEIPKSVFSALITFVIYFLMKFLCLTHDDIFNLKKKEKKIK